MTDDRPATPRGAADTSAARPGEQAEIVTVIIPAFNAIATIDETLDSVRAQTYCNLEIIVVDDGSSDATPERVLAHAKHDARVRLIRQPNAGVAAARNAGLAAAKGIYVAPLDADDLWRPSKIERQVDAMRQAGAGAGLCCTGVCFIDSDGKILGTYIPEPTASPFRAMCRGNIVTNGSAALMPRELVLERGGFDETLRAAGAQGCEDWKLYISVLERHDLVVVPDLLTGYRQYPGQMSGSVEQMIRSAQIVVADMSAGHPGVAPDLAEGLHNLRRYMAGRALTEHHYLAALKLAAPAGAMEFGRFVVLSARRFVGRLLRRARGGPSGVAPGPHFLEGPV